MKRGFVFVLLLALFLVGCEAPVVGTDGTRIRLGDSGITVDGKEISSDEREAVYSARDIVFYLEGQGIAYGEGEKKDEHSQEEADAHTVVHITKPGRYVVSGTLSLGQIAVDLGEDAESDPNAVVTLVLNGADITCTVAPAVIFYRVYECADKEEDNASKDVDTAKAGANVEIADDSVNNVSGAYVAKIFKSCELNGDGTKVLDSKKLHKYDGAFYSKQSLNINGGAKGNGVLNLRAENEGMGSELHLTVNGGVVNITSGNDGVNTNEDGVSVTTVNGGVLNILCNGATGEGDGIDSNGWLVINGGTVIAQACASSMDSGIDSDQGIHINGGKVMASGNMLDAIEGGGTTYVVFSFASRQAGKQTYVLKDKAGNVVGEYSPQNAFTYLVVAGEELVPGEYSLWLGETSLSVTGSEGNPLERPSAAGKPQGEPPKKPQGEPPQGMEPPAERPPEGMEPPAERPPEGSEPMQGMPPFEELEPAEGGDSVFFLREGGNRFFCVAPEREAETVRS